MKNSSAGTKLLMGGILLAVAVYFGIQAYQTLADPMLTAMVYTYRVEDSLSLSGYVVRSEAVLPDAGEGGMLRLVRTEGERVSAGGAVAQVYADQASLDRQAQIDSLQTQLNQLEYAAQAASAAEAAVQLDSQISERLLTIHKALAGDRIDTAEASVSELKALILRRDYTYTDAAELKAQTERIQAQLKTLRAQTAGSVRTVTAPKSGVYSAVVDGYETVLTPAMLEDLTPSVLSGVQAVGEITHTGKLALGDQWYFAAVLPADQAAKLTEGGQEILRFSKGVDRDLKVTVQSVSAAENGQAAVVLRGDTFLSELTLLRRQSADLILSSAEGIRVPQKAVRVSEAGVTGVNCVVGINSRFKPVEILWSGDGYAVVRPAGNAETTVLRPGDEVILSAGGLRDGAVLN